MAPTSLAWLPWALLATDRLAIAEDLRRAARPVAGLAAALALTALAGHTQYLHLAIATVLVYALIVARPFASAARALAGVALVAGLAIPLWFSRHDVTLDNAALLLVRDLRATQSRAAIL